MLEKTITGKRKKTGPSSRGLALPGLLVFADDWGRHPSSCQHLVGHLLDRFNVCWINTIGMREPSLNLATLNRGLEKIRGWVRGENDSEALPANLKVLNPKMWPWISRHFDRKLNRELLLRQLAPVLRKFPAPPVAVTTIPVVADLVGLIPVQRWVYYCVDDFGEWPDLAQEVLRDMEERLIYLADALVAVSATLQDKLARMGREAWLLTHGVDLTFWQSRAKRGPHPLLEGLERPVALFWGVVDRRMDVAFLRQLTGDLPQGTVVLVGPEDNPDPALDLLPRLVRRPPLAFRDLPDLAAEATVLIMPYADLPVTRAMQPLKLKEYLATGKPAVVRELPSTREWADCLDLAASPEAFSRAVRLRLNEGIPGRQVAARLRLQGESWEEKARLFENRTLCR